MMPTFVIDCSITMNWCFEDEATDAAQTVQDRLMDEAAIVPALWPLEVLNALAVARRRGRIAADKVPRFIKILSTFDILVDDQTAARAFEHLPPLCESYGLTSYDAAYLELAMRKELPLGTLDEDLRRAAMNTGVPLLGI
jgi:predicted nucleic acid-binding protein